MTRSTDIQSDEALVELRVVVQHKGGAYVATPIVGGQRRPELACKAHVSGVAVRAAFREILGQ